MRVNKLECHTFNEPPDVAAGVNYFLPADSGVANNCEIRAWDHKDCEKGNGKLVFREFNGPICADHADASRHPRRELNRGIRRSEILPHRFLHQVIYGRTVSWAFQ